MEQQVNITLTGEGIQHQDTITVSVAIEATVNISAKQARRKVTGWLVSEVGNMLIGSTPRLVINREYCLWRVPVMLTSSDIGHVGQVGEVDVNADTGKLVIIHQLKKDILNHVQYLTRPVLSAVA